MLSLRTLARALPRAAPRVASYSSRTASNRLAQTSLRTSSIQIPRHTAAAAFSTSRAQFDSISQELGAKLGNELALELENTSTPTDSDGNVQSFLEQNDFWTLNSPDGEQDVTLTRKYDDEHITVAFSIADFNTSQMMEDNEADEAFGDEEEEIEPAGPKGSVGINQGRTNSGSMKIAPEDGVSQADQEGMEDEDYDSQQAFPVNVNVLIQRPGKGALRANLIADNGVWTINAVSQISETAASAQSIQALLQPDHESAVYGGPPFVQLDEEVQQLFEQYLEARGIDTALALFVPDYIDVKEQREYQGWLERVKEFVD